MEKIPSFHQPEQEPGTRPDVCPPLTDILQSPEQAERIWPEYAAELLPQIEKHTQDARAIAEYLDALKQGVLDTDTRGRFYESASNLLNNPEQERIALFLPFESFPTTDDHSHAAEQFRSSYLTAWSNLLHVQDVRASFVDGDVLEVDARPGDPERVVKAAHLAPWLVQHGLIMVQDVISIASGNDQLLTRSLLETKGLMLDMGLLSTAEQRSLEKIEHSLPERSPTAPPRYITLARQAWLAEKARGIERPAIATHDLDMSFSERLAGLEEEIAVAREITDSIDPNVSYGVAWLGGSRLKGYSQDSSDLDLYIPVKSTAYGEGLIAVDGASTVPVLDIKDDLPSYAHEVFNMAWVGEPQKITALQWLLAPEYFKEVDLQTRKWTTERLEQDLLEYRLLHKGYPRLCPDTNPEYKKYISMDGQSAFYESGYRILATRIFANSIFIPQIRE